MILWFVKAVVQFKVPKEGKRYLVLNTYSRLPQALRGGLVGSIYAVFMMLPNLTSFLPLLVTPPSLDALGSV